MLAVEMMWKAPENKALGISALTTDRCDMSCTNSEGVVTGEKKNPSIVLFNRACAHLKTKECKSIIL